MATAATVGVFLTILQHKLIKQDERENKKHYNLYRIGHYLKAFGDIREDVEGLEDRDDSEALTLLKISMAKRFTSDWDGVPTFSPTKYVWKHVNLWLEQGKLPRLC